MTYLEVPGASLYYEVVGQGPLLLCISGANGSCDLWRDFAGFLKTHFSIVCYDRRGFSRSHLNGAQDYERRLETDADDAAHLIQELSPHEPATVIGNSSGAIVALKLLTRHPDIIRTLIPYEPPLATVLDDVEDYRKKHQETYDTYRRSGMAPAFQMFAEITKADQAMVARMSDSRISPYQFSNTQYWFEREFMYYPFATFDIENELRPVKDKLLLVNGELSSREPYQYRANVCMALDLGIQFVHFPGEHVGHATHPQEFSKKLVEVLKAKDTYYSSV